MKIYLVQHGEAESKSVDPARPLTARGRADVERVAAFAARLGVAVHQIRHSGKTRAGQTAECLGRALNPPGGVVAVPGLDPKDDVRPVAEALEREATAGDAGRPPAVSGAPGRAAAGGRRGALPGRVSLRGHRLPELRGRPLAGGVGCDAGDGWRVIYAAIANTS